MASFHYFNPLKQSRSAESRFYNKLRCVPVVGSLYSIPRFVVYAERGDEEETSRSFLGLVGNLVETGVLIALTGGQGVPWGVIVGGTVMAVAWHGLQEIERSSSENRDFLIKINNLPNRFYAA